MLSLSSLLGCSRQQWVGVGGGRGRERKTFGKMKFCWRVVFFFFLQLYSPIIISPAGNFGCFSWGKSVAIESRYPTYGACWVF